MMPGPFSTLGPQPVNPPFKVNVSSKYGAPMGRPSDPLSDFVGKCHLRVVPFVDGDYDQGGAYWGGGRDTLPVYCAWDNEGHAYYFRAYDRKQAKAKLLLGNTNLKFYR